MTQPTTSQRILAQSESIPVDDIVLVTIDIDLDGTISLIEITFNSYQRVRASSGASSVYHHRWDEVIDLLSSDRYPHGQVEYRFVRSSGQEITTPHHYSTSGSHFHHLSADKKATLLANDVIHQGHNKINYRQKAFHEFIQHQQSLSYEFDAAKREYYFNVCLHWAVAGFDPFNFQDDEMNYPIIQKCQQYDITQFSIDYAQGLWSRVPLNALKKSAAASVDWRLYYPTNPTNEPNIIPEIAAGGNTFLRNAGSAYDPNDNYAKAIHLLTYGIDLEWYGGV